MIVAISVMVVIWLAVMLGRNQIRARWWTYKLTVSRTLDEQAAYLARLASLGDAAVPSAQRLLGEDDPLLRSFGLAILQHAPGRRARDLLVAASADGDPSIRTEAVRGLGVRRDLEALSRIARGAEPVAAAAATVELGRIGTAEAIGVLTDLVCTQECVAVRVEAIECLGGLPGAPDAKRIDVLAKCLDDDTLFEGHTAAERAAMEAAASLQPGQPVDWPSSRRTVGHFAARALERITGRTRATAPTTQDAGSK